MFDLLKRFRRRYIYPYVRPLMPYRRATFGGIAIEYKKHLDGGGSWFGQGFVPFLQGRGMPKVPRAFEWCAGPGFIGFSMLGHGLCETLCLADINPDAVEAVRRTIAANALADRVSVYVSDNLKAIPPSEKWDLVVANPPHFADDYIDNIRFHDPDWRIHRGFFADVGRHLQPGGVVVLQENNAGSTPETFRAMIEGAGLKTVFVQGAEPHRTKDHRFFYLGIMRADDTPPPWAMPL